MLLFVFLSSKRRREFKAVSFCVVLCCCLSVALLLLLLLLVVVAVVTLLSALSFLLVVVEHLALSTGSSLLVLLDASENQQLSGLGGRLGALDGDQSVAARRREFLSLGNDDGGTGSSLDLGDHGTALAQHSANVALGHFDGDQRLDSYGHVVGEASVAHHGGGGGGGVSAAGVVASERGEVLGSLGIVRGRVDVSREVEVVGEDAEHGLDAAHESVERGSDPQDPLDGHEAFVSGGHLQPDVVGFPKISDVLAVLADDQTGECGRDEELSDGFLVVSVVDDHEFVHFGGALAQVSPHEGESGQNLIEGASHQSDSLHGAGEELVVGSELDHGSRRFLEGPDGLSASADEDAGGLVGEKELDGNGLVVFLLVAVRLVVFFLGFRRVGAHGECS